MLKKRTLQKAAAMLVALLLTAINAAAQNVSQEQALSLAQNFLSAKTAAAAKGNAAVQHSRYELAMTLTDRHNVPTVFVYNASGGGYVIVAGEMGTRSEILGYSIDGHIDADNLQPQLRDVLENYSQEIAKMRVSGRRELPAMATGKSVAPLLGDIEWGQDAPFDRYTQIINGNHAPTGCVATATAQVMRYWQWPKAGKGSHSYQNNGETLSADFNHEYHWDLMLPSYNGTYTDAQADAVARLMSDLGVAFNMHYQDGTSGANYYADRMVEYFGYDKSQVRLYFSSCTVDYYEDVLRSELDAKRPVICSGSNGNGGHEFIIDGYDADGMMHYNFGWRGSSNGYFLSTACGYDIGQSFVYGVQPEAGGNGQLSFRNEKDFMWSEGNKIKCDMFFYFLCGGGDIDFGVEALNMKDNSVTYTVVHSGQDNTYALDFEYEQSLPDGTYQLYPVVRSNGGEWQRVPHFSLRQGVIDLTVEGGKNTYANNYLYDEMDEGKFEVDGIFYRIDYNEAYVTSKNSLLNSYKVATVTIPETVTYNGETYTVRHIDDNAFAESERLEEVNLPKTLFDIGMGAFYLCTNLKSINFAPDTNEFSSIYPYAFNFCLSLENINIPQQCSILGTGLFQGCESLKSFDFPIAAVQRDYQSYYAGMVSDYVFTLCTNLKTLYVHWVHPVDCEAWIFDQIDPSTIHLKVPKGTKANYEKVSPWNQCIIEETDEDADQPDAGKVLIDGLWYTLNDDASTATVVNKNIQLYSYDTPDIVIPRTVSHGGKEYTVTAIGDDAFAFCTGIKSVVVNASLSMIGQGAFRGCENVESIILAGNGKPELVTSVYSFAGCKKLTRMTLPNAYNVEWLLFGDCTSLSSVYISIVSYVSQYCFSNFAFKNCPALTDIYLKWNKPSELYNETFEDVDVRKITLHVLPGQAATYKTLNVWKDMNIVEDFVDGIHEVVSDQSDAVIYDITGRKVQTPAHGIYIINGKKVQF